MKQFTFEITEPDVQEVIRAFTHSSSWIGNVRYDPDTQIMNVKMRGKDYTFPGVTDREFDAFEGAPSKGRHLHQLFLDNRTRETQEPLLSLGGEQTLIPDIASASFTQELAIPGSLSGIDVLGLKKKQGETQESDDLGAPCPCNNLDGMFVDSHMSTVSIPPWQYEPEQYTAIQESIQSHFNYADPNHLQQVKQVMREQHMEGKILLIKASEETITDHRATSVNPIEQQYRRRLSSTEIHAMARTGIGKGSDINHYGPDYATGGKVMDAEANPDTGEMQIVHYEPDPEIIQAIQSGSIQAVSINGGKPRNLGVSCNEMECFAEPTGIILGEMDNIAFTYVVTDPRGIVWRGRYVPPAEPGIKTTEIEILS